MGPRAGAMSPYADRGNGREAEVGEQGQAPPQVAELGRQVGTDGKGAGEQDLEDGIEVRPGRGGQEIAAHGPEHVVRKNPLLLEDVTENQGRGPAVKTHQQHLLQYFQPRLGDRRQEGSAPRPGRPPRPRTIGPRSDPDAPRTPPAPWRPARSSRATPRWRLRRPDADQPTARPGRTPAPGAGSDTCDVSAVLSSVRADHPRHQD